MVAAPASQTLSIANMIRAQYASDKVSLPLSGGISYVGFEHVQGVPSEGADGFSVYRLKLLDLMIDRLSSGHADAIARQELSNVTAELRDAPSLANNLISDGDGSTRAFLMNLVA